MHVALYLPYLPCLKNFLKNLNKSILLLVDLFKIY